jgi:hypothetical protein
VCEGGKWGGERRLMKENTSHKFCTAILFNGFSSYEDRHLGGECLAVPSQPLWLGISPYNSRDYDE